MKSLKNKVSSGIGALKRVRPFVSMHTAIEICKCLIEPHFDYCSAVWDGLTQRLREGGWRRSAFFFPNYFQTPTNSTHVF